MKPRFTLRDLLWLAPTIGLGLGWWFDHRSQVAKREFDRQVLEYNGYAISDDGELTYDLLKDRWMKDQVASGSLHIDPTSRTFTPLKGPMRRTYPSTRPE